MNKLYKEKIAFDINDECYVGKIERVEWTRNSIYDNNQCRLVINDVSPYLYFKPDYSIPEIKKVIFNDPATIVYWGDGTKTVVKKQKPDSKKKFDPEKGLAMAIAKKALGNTGRYFETIKEWCE